MLRGLILNNCPGKLLKLPTLIQYKSCATVSDTYYIIKCKIFIYVTVSFCIQFVGTSKNMNVVVAFGERRQRPPNLTSVVCVNVETMLSKGFAKLMWPFAFSILASRAFYQEKPAQAFFPPYFKYISHSVFRICFYLFAKLNMRPFFMT